ncbi:MAG: type II toxin-antitoxin system antitoxin SocA domain-containing protein [Pontixanthobacter sp.]
MEDGMGKKSPLSANDVADWFINRVDETKLETITMHEVLDLVYFAQAWHLAETGRPLFADEIEAWALGPTVPAVFDRFERMNSATIPAINTQRVISGLPLEILEAVAEEYEDCDEKLLRTLATIPDGPWAKERIGQADDMACHKVIAHEAMTDYYQGKIEENVA